MAWYAGFERIQSRLADRNGLEMYAPDGRRHTGGCFAITRSSAPAWGRLNSSIPLYDSTLASSIATHAENEYAQLAGEMGISGFIIVLAFVALIWRAYFRAMRRDDLPIRIAAAGLGFGLLAVMIHSLSDFGQHLPAIACMSAVTCGLMLNVAGVDEIESRRRSRRPVTFGMLLIVVGVAAWAISDTSRSFRAERHWRVVNSLDATLEQSGWQGTDEQFTALLEHAEAAVAAQPGDVRKRYSLNVYRWKNLKHEQPTLDTPQATDEVKAIVADLLDARRLCPTFGPLYYMAGQLEGPCCKTRPAGGTSIRGSSSLRMTDSRRYLSGSFDARSGDFDSAVEKYRRMIALDWGMMEDAIEVLVDELERT